MLVPKVKSYSQKATRYIQKLKLQAKRKQHQK